MARRQSFTMHYVLGPDGRTPRPASFAEWGAGAEVGREREQLDLPPAPGDGWARVAHDVIGDVVVSTVFLGLNHDFGRRGPPILFETMIFGGPHHEYQDRYSTWDEAEAGHKAALWLAAADSNVRH